ncbi:GDSL esterase lipase [Musa troglodytarum]|uniref:GDSL esterase lipase n=1 Tax=Musa troglodytarum TaxID=320322 RepID=A0A9E7JLM9_9LILI|nr:GDSL esterase lipase [Musa troglodytarum]
MAETPSAFFSAVVVTILAVLGGCSAPSEAARAFFVFGDSLVDNGNNNYLATTARADAPPYGIDSPSHRPSGRFSNGRNIPDIISEQLGAETTLPYLSPELRGEKLLVGANFASAGIGILNDTGIQFVNIIRINRQLQYFEEYQKKLSALIGASQAEMRVNQALVLITLGGNDFVNNYYLIPYSFRSRQFALPDYVRYLISEYYKILQVEHSLKPSILSSMLVHGCCSPERDWNSRFYSFCSSLFSVPNSCRGYMSSGPVELSSPGPARSAASRLSLP